MASPTTPTYAASTARSGDTPGLDRAAAALTRSRPVLWTVLVLQGVSFLRSFRLSHLGWRGWTMLAVMLVSLLLLLAYNDALGNFRTLRNQRNLERLTRSHALVWALMAALAVLQLL